LPVLKMKTLNNIWFIVFTMPLIIAGMTAGYLVSCLVVCVIRPIALGVIEGWKEGQRIDD
jgi:hypothetical protein